MFIVHMQLAGIVFRIQADVDILTLPSPRYRLFQISQRKPDVLHRYWPVSEQSCRLPSSFEKLARAARFVCHGPEGSENPLLRSSIVHKYLEARLSDPNDMAVELRYSSLTILDFGRRELYIFHTPELGSVITNSRLGPLAFAPFMPMFSSVLVHCGSVVRNGKTALFLAPDEGGKTTAVKLARDGVVLSDDQTAIRIEGNDLFAHGLPWGAVSGGSRQAPVGGFFLLEKAHDFELAPLGPEDALEYLWNEHQYYINLMSRRQRLHAFELISEVSRRAPVYRMRFPKDYIDWDAIDRAMN